MEPRVESAGLEVRSYFVRGRNALVTRAQLGDLYIDYYLHQGQLGRQHAVLHDGMLKEALAAVLLHGASRPWNESIAWTLHWEALSLNLFVSCENPTGRVVGQIFTEDVKKTGRNLFCSDVVRTRSTPSRSVVEFEDGPVLGAVEWFYLQSEQRPARFFEIEPEDFVMISAQPDCQEGWIEGLTLEQVRTLDSTETLSLLERRQYRWECGCSQERMLQILATAMGRDPEGLFGGDASLRMNCPRCGNRYVVTREVLEAYAESRG
jgi:molecular chaperone Hsp33